MKLYLIAAAVLLAFLLHSCNQETTFIVDDKAISDEEQTSNWLSYGRTHNESRFSPATDINTDNVFNLKVDWYLDLPNDVGLVSTPLVVNEVLYFIGSMNVVRAIDAASGELIWEFNPMVADHIKNKMQIGWMHNRGISFYKGKVLLATWDGRLIAIDAKDGKQIWSVHTFDPESSLYITGAPKAFKDKVIIGNGGTEWGPTRGYVTAYDIETGQEAWKFYIVPGNPADGFENEAMEMAAKTWTGEWWKHGGGGNAWHGFTYDADLDVLYFGTGNGSPWNRTIRSDEGGDNLFLCSIVAVDPDSGKYLWHYQTTPGESWDYNSNMDIVLADLEIEGQKTKVILHAPKNGFFYVINRETGKLISAEPFVETSWASHIDMESGRPVEIEGARYENGQAYITPSPAGAHNWQAMSYNPSTGLVYIPVSHFANYFSDENIDVQNWQGSKYRRGTGVELLPPDTFPREYFSSLIAWDPVAQEQRWIVPQKATGHGGTLTTAGNLVFQGTATGQFKAFHTETGEELWSYETGLGISAPPITYRVDNKQFISVLVGFGGGITGVGSAITRPLGWAYRMQTRRLITFSLDGEAIVPDQPPPFLPEPIDASDFIVNEDLANVGAVEYLGCRHCHGPNAIAGGMAPDLRASPIPLDSTVFAMVVKEGLKVEMGMPAFPNLSDEKLEMIRHYIRQKANETQ